MSFKRSLKQSCSVSHTCFLSLLSPSSQESILQKVVMTAFADRTVVTIAVSISPTTLCRSLRRLQ